MGTMLDGLAPDQSSILGHVLRLAGAFILALPIGWNREYRSRSGGGIRTFTLVSIACCAFILAVRSSSQSSETVARVLQGLLAGIGFIGSGAIIRHRSRSHGSATAASIWTTAAIGVAVALDQFDIAIVLSVSTYAILRWMAPLSKDKEIADASRKREMSE